MVNFILNYADEHGYPLAAARRGTDDLPPIYLPASVTKLAIHKIYERNCSEAGVRIVKYRSFVKTWNQCCPHIKIACPQEDVCAKCELCRKAINDAVTEEEKLQASRQLTEHINIARTERDVYKSCIESSKDELHGLDLPDDVVPPLSTEYKHVHYTFDFAQSIAIPHHYRQIGPLYFLSLRKINLFGLRLDGLPKQMNFIIDEDETIGQDGKETHGANAVISMLHFGLWKYGLGEKSCLFHADNCGGQNKNQFVIAYFAWRILTGLHKSIQYLMQVPGHTKCLVDSGFAHIKRAYRRSDCETLDHISHIVNCSSVSNEAVMFKNEPELKWYDWKMFLPQYFKAIPGIRSYQQFRFDADQPGVVFVKKHEGDEETAVSLMKPGAMSIDPTAMPTVILPGGLSLARKKYLYSKVRPFLRVHCRDSTCPAPDATEE